MANTLIPEDFGGNSKTNLGDLIRKIYQNGRAEEQAKEVDSPKQSPKSLAVGINATTPILKLENPKIRYCTREGIWNVENHLNIQGTAYIMSSPELYRRICTTGYEGNEKKLLPYIIKHWLLWRLNQGIDLKALSPKANNGTFVCDIEVNDKKFNVNPEKLQQVIDYYSICRNSGNGLVIVSDLETLKPVTRYGLNGAEYSTTPLEILPKRIEVIGEDAEIEICNKNALTKIIDTKTKLTRLSGGKNKIKLDKLAVAVDGLAGRVTHNYMWSEAEREKFAGYSGSGRTYNGSAFVEVGGQSLMKCSFAGELNEIKGDETK